jgi:hypothetical protein
MGSQGLKPGALNWILLVQPRRLVAQQHVHGGQVLRRGQAGHDGAVAGQGVAVQVALKNKGLEPVSRFIDARVEIRRLQAMSQLDSTCTAPPGRGTRAPS